MKIQVTAEDIAKGERDSCLSCPIALAVRRAFDMPLWTVWVDADSIRVPGERASLGRTESRWFNTPDTAQEFIEDLDNGETVAPFEFELTALQP